MAPILIDKRDLLKLGFLSILVAATLFSGGVLFGYEKATTIHQAGSEVKILTLPGKLVEASELEPQPPEVMAAGESIDVDYPGLAAGTTNEKRPLPTDQNFAEPADNAANVSVTRATVSRVTKKSGALAPSSLKLLATAEKNNLITPKPVADVVTTAQKIQPVLFSSLTSDQINNINYSIQLGAYGRLINAEKMMAILHAKNLDAYVTDYINKKGETRYNVRMGYFTDKKTAISALKRYRSTEKGDGYLVKFSAESMVNVADVKTEKIPVSINEAVATITPSINSAEVTVDKVSTAEVTSASQDIKIITAN